MVGNEWLSGGTAGEQRSDRRFNFHETKFIEETADVINDLRALNEDIARVFVEDEVEITLAVTRFLILEAEMTRRKLVQVGGKKDHGAR